MFHPSRKGIYCDLCGEEVLITGDSIEYYSINMKKIIDRVNMAKDINDVLDLDFCSKCHDRMRERVLKVSEINDKKKADYVRKHV